MDIPLDATGFVAEQRLREYDRRCAVAARKEGAYSHDSVTERILPMAATATHPNTQTNSDERDDTDEATRSRQERERSERRENDERDRSRREREERHDQLERSEQDEENYRLRELREARALAEDRAVDRQNSRRYMQYADRQGAHAVRALVRSTNEAFTSLIPRAWVRPGAVLRAWFDVASMSMDLQRAAWDEMTQVWREDTQRVARSARTDERVDIDREWEQERERIGR